MATSRQSNLTTDCIAAAHGRFSGIRQVVLVCTPPNTCFLGPTQLQIQNAISVGPAVFADRPTDRPHYSVYGRIYVRSTAMRPIIIRFDGIFYKQNGKSAKYNNLATQCMHFLYNRLRNRGLVEQRRTSLTK